MKKRLLLYVFLVAIGCCVQAQEKWDLGTFVKTKENPIVKADSTLSFFCPVKKEQVKWQKADVFNPAAIVKDGKVYLFTRSEDNPKAILGDEHRVLDWLLVRMEFISKILRSLCCSLIMMSSASMIIPEGVRTHEL